MRSSAAASPVGSILVIGAAEVEDALVHDLSITAAHQLWVQVACKEKEQRS